MCGGRWRRVRRSPVRPLAGLGRLAGGGVPRVVLAAGRVPALALDAEKAESGLATAISDTLATGLLTATRRRSSPRLSARTWTRGGASAGTCPRQRGYNPLSINAARCGARSAIVIMDCYSSGHGAAAARLARACCRPPPRSTGALCAPSCSPGRVADRCPTGACRPPGLGGRRGRGAGPGMRGSSGSAAGLIRIDPGPCRSAVRRQCGVGRAGGRPLKRCQRRHRRERHGHCSAAACAATSLGRRSP